MKLFKDIVSRNCQIRTGTVHALSLFGWCKCHCQSDKLHVWKMLLIMKSRKVFLEIQMVTFIWAKYNKIPAILHLVMLTFGWYKFMLRAFILKTHLRTPLTTNFGVSYSLCSSQPDNPHGSCTDRVAGCFCTALRYALVIMAFHHRVANASCKCLEVVQW